MVSEESFNKIVERINAKCNPKMELFNLSNVGMAELLEFSIEDELLSGDKLRCLVGGVHETVFGTKFEDVWNATVDQMELLMDRADECNENENNSPKYVHSEFTHIAMATGD